MTTQTPGPTPAEPEAAALVRRHLVFGWGALLLFLTLGVVLEGLHGLKVRWYLDASNETRRLLFTLGHAHGTLLALVNLAFAATVSVRGPFPGARGASRALVAATWLLPAGFLLGGLVVYGGDPWVGILLVPVGAAALFLGVLLTLRGCRGGR